MAKIFISLFSNIKDPENKYAIPCFYETIIKSFERLGNQILVYISTDFEQKFIEIPSDLKQKIKAFDPDVCFLFNNTFFDCSSFLECPIVVYEVDSPLLYSNKESLKKNISRYKFIVVQDCSVEKIAEEYHADKKNITKLPFFTEIQPRKEKISNNICFIGSRFIQSSSILTPYLKFLSSQPSFEEKQDYLKLLYDFSKKTWISEEDFWALHPNTSEKIIHHFNFKEIMFFLSDYNRRFVLSSIADLDLDLYGTKNWEWDGYNEPGLILNYHPEAVYSLKQNETVYNSCKIGININHLQTISGFSWRVCDIMASNACLVSEYKSDIKKYFNNIIPTFESSYDARALCVRLLKNENQRQDIVSASQEIINEKFRFKNILPSLEGFLGMNFTNKTNGNTEFILENCSEKEKYKLSFKYKIMEFVYRKLDKKLKKKGLIK